MYKECNFPSSLVVLAIIGDLEALYIYICIYVLMLCWNSTSLNKVTLTQGDTPRRFAAAPRTECGSWLVSGSILLATPSAGETYSEDLRTLKHLKISSRPDLPPCSVGLFGSSTAQASTSCAPAPVSQFFQTDNDPRGTTGDSENQLVPLRTRTQNKAANTVVWDS